MKRDTTMTLIDVEPTKGVPSRDGFFLCGHCQHVVELTQREVDAAENAPAGSLMKLKCPRCHHREVSWRFSSVPKPRPVPLSQIPVSRERARELFAQIFQRIQSPQ